MYSLSELHFLTVTPESETHLIWLLSVAICKLLSVPICHVAADLLLYRSFQIDQHVLLLNGHSLLKNGPGPTVWWRERYIQIEINHKSLIHHHDSCENILPSPLPLLPSWRPLRSFHILPLKRTKFWKPRSVHCRKICMATGTFIC